MDSILSRVEITTTNYIFLYLQLTWNKNRPGTNILSLSFHHISLHASPCLFFLSFQIWFTSKENASLFYPVYQIYLIHVHRDMHGKIVIRKKGSDRMRWKISRLIFSKRLHLFPTYTLPSVKIKKKRRNNIREFASTTYVSLLTILIFNFK